MHVFGKLNWVRVDNVQNCLITIWKNDIWSVPCIIHSATVFICAKLRYSEIMGTQKDKLIQTKISQTYPVLAFSWNWNKILEKHVRTTKWGDPKSKLNNNAQLCLVPIHKKICTIFLKLFTMLLWSTNMTKECCTKGRLINTGK